MKNKYLLSLLIILLLVSASLFAGGSNEGNVFYIPRNVVNNSNIMIELSVAKQLSTIDADYSDSSTDNLAIFRLRDSLYTSNGNKDVTISSLSNWRFVHENNPTSYVNFELNAFCTERKNVSRDYSSDVDTKALGSTDTTLKSGQKSYLKKDGNVYKLCLNTNGFTTSGFSMYADYIREYDICIKLPSDTTGVEPGYYTTTITVQVPTFTKHKVNTGWSPSLSTNGTGSITETITIRGYIGVEYQQNDDVSFTVHSAKDTYTMDLGISGTQNDNYDIANLSLYHVGLTNSSPDTNTQKNKYTIYISPTSNYNTAGTYQFIRMNSEYQARTDANTVYYDIYSSASGSTKFTKLSTSVPTTYYIRPTYSSEQISESGVLGGEDQWKETWTLNQEIYLKLTTTSLSNSHEQGLYYSYIYFTLVSN